MVASVFVYKETVVKQIVSSSLFISPLAGFIKQHVDATIPECRLTQLYSKSKKVEKTRVPLFPIRSSSDATDKSENKPKSESSMN